ncbi:helix-turn-helix transcriptional regulator [Sinorhizobium meliloti]|uniref:helix-turn-helix transcriptional regulator n=1 Tax=Rhizobium meliloti TaxID=382 RepID=UPI001F3D344B|nr:hypothetical protein [Sinorhizobium meliloti]
MNDSPRLIGRKEAAAYCGISPTCFSMWVASNKMPPAIPGTRKWDKRAIDAKLDEISGLDVPEKQAETGCRNGGVSATCGEQHEKRVDRNHLWNDLGLPFPTACGHA